MRMAAERGFDRPAQTRSYHDTVMMMMIVMIMMMMVMIVMIVMMMMMSNFLLPGQALEERRSHMRGKSLGEPSPWIFRMIFYSILFIK